MAHVGTMAEKGKLKVGASVVVAPMGPGIVVGVEHARDLQVYRVVLEWRLANGAKATAFVLEKALHVLGAQ